MTSKPSTRWIDSPTAGPLLSITPITDGFSIEIPLEVFEDLGATAEVISETLVLEGSPEVLAKVFAALVEAGTKGAAATTEPVRLAS